MKITDVVFTNHAIDRMKQRGVTGDWVWQTVKQPDEKLAGKEKFTTEFVKKFGNFNVTTIGRKNDLGEWVVLSVWMDPPIEGTKDYHKNELYKKNKEKDKNYFKKMNKSSFWGKLWLTFRKQSGL